MSFEEQLARAMRRGGRAIPVRELDLADAVTRGRRGRRLNLVVAAGGLTAMTLVVATLVGRLVITEPEDLTPAPPAGGGSCTPLDPTPGAEEPALGEGDAVSYAEATPETDEEAREFASRPDNRADRAVGRWIDLIIEGDEDASWRMIGPSVQREITREGWHDIIEKGGLASVYSPLQEPPNAPVHGVEEISAPGEGWLYVVTLSTKENDAAAAIPAFVPVEGEVEILAPAGGVQFLVPDDPEEVVPCDVVFEAMIDGSRPASAQFFIEVTSVRGEVTEFAEPADGVYTARFDPDADLEPGSYIATVVVTGRDGISADAITFTVEGDEAP